VRDAAHASTLARENRPKGSAWGVVGVTTGFIALTCWWLSRDRSIPIYDAGTHLQVALTFHNWILAGHLSKPFTFTSQYPPLAPLVGAWAAFIGGVNVASPIIGENLIFVPLLTLGCYQTGRLLFGARAGLLAAVFVLGSPLLIAQFHVFMLDAPETALVAVATWLILASEEFSRTRIAAWAGLAVGCGLLIKAQFPFFVAGIVLVALARGGWRHRRGLAAFAATALVVGAPWYLDHVSDFREMALTAGGGTQPAGHVPAALSMVNLTWYFWSALNWLLFAPLFMLALVGAIWTIWAVVHERIPKGPVMEFLVGAFVAWLAITLTPSHDIRYDLPLLPYLAVIGTGWIICASRRWVRVVAMAVLALAVAANSLGATFGVGGRAQTALGSSPIFTQAFPDRIVWYSNGGFLVAAPQRDGDVPGLLRALRHDGVRVVAFSNPAAYAPAERGRTASTGRSPADFSIAGLQTLSLIAHLSTSRFTVRFTVLAHRSPQYAALIHRSIASGAPPCTKLSDGTGVWVVRLNPAAHRLSLYCPDPRPRFYPGVVQQVAPL